MSKKPSDLQLDREQKVKIIRRCFKSQPLGGWSKPEVAGYLKTLKIEPRSKTDDLTDEEIDLIFEDLRKSKMI